MQTPLSDLTQQANRALNRQDFHSLDAISRKLLELDSSQPDPWFFLSLVELARRRIVPSVNLIDHALSLDPDNAEYLTHKAKLHSLVNQRRNAAQAASKALSLSPKSALLLDTLGVVFSRLELHEKAREVFKRAVEIHPNNAQFQFNLASVEQFLGNEDCARACYEKAIALQPKFYRAHWALSELEKTQSDSKRLAVLLQHFNEKKHNPDDQLYLGHSISREYEKIGDYDKAFEFLTIAKQDKRKAIKYSIEQDKRLFAALKSAFSDSERYDSPSSNTGENNVFVLGMPRSGTTLVDRILSTHTRIESLGELQDFPKAVKLASGSKSSVILDEEVIAASSQNFFEDIGSRYLNYLSDRTEDGFKYIDKMPLNYLYIGHIFQSLPKAKIICLLRNPLDTCLSNFRQLFAVNFSYYNYHYDLSDTAEYYCLFHDLVQYWKSLFGDRLLTVSYEALVANPKEHVQAMLDYIGVEFEAECLEFHKNRTAVSTASTMQVRQPLNKNSLGRWRKYGENMQPVMTILDQHGIEYK